MAYCVQDVVYLPKLFGKYNAKLANAVFLDATISTSLSTTGSQNIWAYRVVEASAERVVLSQSEDFDNKRMDMKKGGQMTTSYPRPCFYYFFIPQTTNSYPKGV